MKSKISIALGVLSVIIIVAFLLKGDSVSITKKADLAAVSIAELFNGKDTYKELLSDENAKYVADTFIYDLNEIVEEQLAKDEIVNLSEIRNIRYTLEEDSGVEGGNAVIDDGMEHPADYISEEPVEIEVETEEADPNDPITDEYGQIVNPEEISQPRTGESNTTEGVFEANGEFLIYREDIVWDTKGTATIFFDNDNMILYRDELGLTYNEMVESLSYTFVDYDVIGKEDFRYYAFESADKTNILNITIQLSENKLQHITLKIDKVS